jgi:MerR family transcriptional regulator, mercuric resistance operon regulatory protein
VEQKRSDYPEWSIGRLARVAGCSVETVRHYERIGLLPPPRRSTAGHRLYDDADLQRLIFIRRSRALGFSQAQIGEMLAAVAPDASCDGRRVVGRTVRAQLESVRSDLRRLRRLEAALAAVATECERLPEAGTSGFIEALFGVEPGDDDPGSSTEAHLGALAGFG